MRARVGVHPGLWRARGAGGAFNVVVVAVVVTGRSSLCADETVVPSSGVVSSGQGCCRGDESGSGTSTGVTPDMTTLNDICA